eukprot:jgi/Galph1/314/GphlegSOOS_G5076.1
MGVLVRLISYLFIFFIFLHFVHCSVIRGVHPRLAHLYVNRNGFFKCINSSHTIPFSNVNDDFCDCPDGTDEPGTSACDGSSFYCENIGYLPKTIPSSQVNDGLCDCCDGSDEWLEYVSCPNRCKEMGLNRVNTLLARVKVVKAGLDSKEKLKHVAAAKSNDLTNKRSELRATVEARMQSQKTISEQLKTLEEVFKLSESVTSYKPAVVTDLLENTSETPNEDDHSEETRTVEGFNEEENGSFSNSVHEPNSSCKESEEHLLSACHNISYSFSFNVLNIAIRKVLIRVLRYMPLSNSLVEILKFKADSELLRRCINKIRSDLEKQNSQLESDRAELDRLEKVAATNYGKDSIFLALKDECAEFHSQGYHYKLCLLSHVLQDNINLGKFSGWNSNYTTMFYTDGTPCWNGPQRSTVVKLICGSNETIVSVSEPTKCEYHFVYSTCAACTKEELFSYYNEAQTILSRIKVNNATSGLAFSPFPNRHDEL